MKAEIMAEQGTYLYLDGIQQLANEVAGNEKIYSGIRPYALHAGNVLSIAAYPYLLCEATKARGIEPRFEFVVSINDWEQDQLIGEDIYKYTFDTKPSHTTIAHTYEKDGTKVVDKWQPEIEKEVLKLKDAFPQVSINFVRNSSLRDHPLMKNAILETIANPTHHKNLLLSVTNRETNGSNMRFANALCPKCKSANTNTMILNSGKLKTTCENCSNEATRNYEDCDFWLYHKQLFPPRFAIFDFDITISGADHYLEGDYQARRALFEAIYKQPMPPVKMAFAPIVLAEDGKKMSKSRKNDFYIPLEDILPNARSVHSPSLQFTIEK